MLQIGVIGLGNHFVEHILNAIMLCSDLNVAVICDIDQAKIDHAKLYLPEAKVTTNWQDLFSMDLDAVFCVSFPQLHEAVIEQGIVNNLPVFVEKPPFMSSKSIARLMELKRENNYILPVGVGINFNYSAMATVVKKLIESGNYGRALEVDLCFLSNKPNSDVWGINNPLKTMLLAQAIHPLMLIKIFIDDLRPEDVSFITTKKDNLSIVKMLIPGYKDNLPVSGTIRTGNLGPKFLFRMSVTFENGTRIECTPEKIEMYTRNQETIAGSNKWSQVWEAKPFMSGIEKGGYFQEISEFVEAIHTKDGTGVYSPDYYYQAYQIIDRILVENE
jgi:phthalate 4,5-cis-dihydrodiol dehydrogenase